MSKKEFIDESVNRNQLTGKRLFFDEIEQRIGFRVEQRGRGRLGNEKNKCVPFILIILPMLISLLFVVGCSDEAPKKPKNQNVKKSGDYIEFKLGKEDFKIHKAYFQGGAESRWGVLYYAKFWALLPDFETYDRAKNGYEFVERLGWGRKLYFQMHLREKDRNAVADIVDNHKGKRGHKRFSGRLENPDERQCGLEVYRVTNYSSDDYLYRPNDETVIYITCGSKIMNVPYPHCKMMWDPFDSVYADATFSKDYLPQWREILSNIQKIFNGQMVEGD